MIQIRGRPATWVHRLVRPDSAGLQLVILTENQMIHKQS